VGLENNNLLNGHLERDPPRVNGGHDDVSTMNGGHKVIPDVARLH
jgi:hypothetical protein